MRNAHTRRISAQVTFWRAVSSFQNRSRNSHCWNAIIIKVRTVKNKYLFTRRSSRAAAATGNEKVEWLLLWSYVTDAFLSFVVSFILKYDIHHFLLMYCDTFINMLYDSVYWLFFCKIRPRQFCFSFFLKEKISFAYLNLQSTYTEPRLIWRNNLIQSSKKITGEYIYSSSGQS